MKCAGFGFGVEAEAGARVQGPHNSSWLPASAAGVGRATEGELEAGLADAKSGLDLSPQILGSPPGFVRKRLLKSFASEAFTRTWTVRHQSGQARGKEADDSPVVAQEWQRRLKSSSLQ